MRQLPIGEFDQLVRVALDEEKERKRAEREAQRGS